MALETYTQLLATLQCCARVAFLHFLMIANGIFSNFVLKMSIDAKVSDHLVLLLAIGDECVFCKAAVIAK